MGGFFGGDEQRQTQESKTTNSMYQQDYFDKLLGEASAWFDQGGLKGGPDYTNDMRKNLMQQAKQYQDMMHGTENREALSNALRSQADEAQTNFDRNILPSIRNTANQAGTSNSSRRGIAEGLAASDFNKQLSNQQAQTINQFEQNAMNQKMAGAQGLGNVFGQMANLQGIAQNNSDQAKQLQSMLALQGLISGNMGGTSSTKGSGTSEGGGQSGFGQLLGAITTGAGAYGSMMGASDEKLKKKIKKVKDKDGKDVKTKDGIQVKEWEWNEEGEKLGLKGKATGVIAQEARKKRPDAVKRNKQQNALNVDYGALMM